MLTWIRLEGSQMFEMDEQGEMPLPDTGICCFPLISAYHNSDVMNHCSSIGLSALLSL